MVTHSDLIKIGARWLKKHEQNSLIPNCSFIVSELTTATSTGEIPDIIGWCSWVSVLIEVKVSRADFLRESNKVFRNIPENGIGEFRFFLCPKNLIIPSELPENWGLLYCNEKGKIEMVRVATKQKANLDCERTMLMSVIRRNNLKDFKNKLIELK